LCAAFLCCTAADSRKQVLHTQLNEVEAQLAAQLADVQRQLEAKRVSFLIASRAAAAA
jgi:hypothetical protein